MHGKYFIVIAIFFIPSIHCFSQDAYQLTLDKGTVNYAAITFNKVMDGRKDKASIGWVQTGMMNKRRIATLEKGFDNEVGKLFERSGLLTPNAGDGIIALVTRLYINETTKAMSELGRAEVGVSFFKLLNADTCYFITSVTVAHEHSSVDVTPKHDENIALAFEKAIKEFEKKRGGIEAVDTRPILVSQLGEPSLVLRDLSSVAILNTKIYNDGIFTTFDELLNNKPSITNQFEIKEGKKIKVYRVASDGGKSSIRAGVYGVAKNNKLYILFNKQFFELEITNNSLQFTGPVIPNPNAVATGAMLGGAIGGAIAAGSGKIRKRYEIDFDNGLLLEIGIVKE